MGAVKDLHLRCVEAAQHFLARKGYEVLEHGWLGEEGVDLVARSEEDVLVFLDVVARSEKPAALPEEEIDDIGRRRFERAALAYIEEHWIPECEVRFDILSVAVIDGRRAFLRHHMGA